MLPKKIHSGFTLIELLVVISIIALLATLTAASVNRARQYARRTKAESDLAAIAKSIEMLALDTGEWPGHQTPYGPCSGCSNNELEDLTAAEAGLKITDGFFPNWSGPYMQILTADPWGNNYFFDSDYNINGTDYAVVGSYGPNGRGLNEYDDDDIYLIISR